MAGRELILGLTGQFNGAVCQPKRHDHARVRWIPFCHHGHHSQSHGEFSPSVASSAVISRLYFNLMTDNGIEIVDPDGPCRSMLKAELCHATPATSSPHQIYRSTFLNRILGRHELIIGVGVFELSWARKRFSDDTHTVNSTKEATCAPNTAKSARLLLLPFSFGETKLSD